VWLNHNEKLSPVGCYGQCGLMIISNEALPVERFLGFIPSVGHKGSGMEQALLKNFCELIIDLKYCRGQSYDNAFNMSGIYNGLQTRIKNYLSTVFFVP